MLIPVSDKDKYARLIEHYINLGYAPHEARTLAYFKSK